jgi:hypothetical protein
MMPPPGQEDECHRCGRISPEGLHRASIAWGPVLLTAGLCEACFQERHPRGAWPLLPQPRQPTPQRPHAAGLRLSGDMAPRFAAVL